MANEYSVEIHNYISAKIAEIEKEKIIAENHNDPAAVSYCSGQLQELTIIRQYLNEKIDLKTQKYY